MSRGGMAALLGLALGLCLLVASPAQAFYLPGVAPQDYERVRRKSGTGRPIEAVFFFGTMSAPRRR